MGCSDEIPKLSPFINYCTGETKSTEEIQKEMLRAVSDEDYRWAQICVDELKKRGAEYQPEKFDI